MNEIDSLYNYLDEQDTKAFIVLKDGKIVLEKYFGSFTKDSSWYWASAGKTITSFLIGKAQEENFLSINDSSSKYLGSGWTNCAASAEGKIKISNQLTMTSGLNDDISDNHCTSDSCLTCISDAGKRWAYHNAPYTLLENVLTKATGNSLNTYTQNKLKSKTGITGSWVSVNFDNVFFSKPRSMARFGLLMQNNCIWNKDSLLHDDAYVAQMTNTSQLLNHSYGYLWWLNGKKSYMFPGSQLIIPGSLAPNAPSDMFAGLGKNGQLLCISKSLGLVVVRMGNQSSGNEVPIQLCNQIWNKLNAVMCYTSGYADNSKNDWIIYPNPTSDIINIGNLLSETDYVISNPTGQMVLTGKTKGSIELSKLNAGVYFLKIETANSKIILKIIKQ